MTPSYVDGYFRKISCYRIVSITEASWHYPAYLHYNDGLLYDVADTGTDELQ